MSDYLIGTAVTLRSTFRDSRGIVVSPSQVNLKYKKPNGTILTVSVSPTGNVYSTEVVLDVAGNWLFRWESTGSGATAKEFNILVQDTRVK